MKRSANRSTIKSRWLTNIFLVTSIFLVAVSCLLIYSVYKRYNHAAEILLKSISTDIVDTYFSYYDDYSFNDAAVNFTETFESRDTIEAWVIDKSGVPIASTGGYDVSGFTALPDYYEAVESNESSVVKKVRMPWGEPAMALSHILRNDDGSEKGAIRYIVSLKDVNSQLALIGGIIISCIGLIIMLMFNTGYYFVSSIVNPVKVISNTAKRIAKGDFSARIIIPHSNDEIGELCDTINDMAEQIGEIDNLKNSFISTVSHEIRTPLTAIKGWGETLLDIDENEKELRQKGISIIINETTRLTGMVEELLDFSRIQSGKLTMNNGIVDIIAEIQQAYLMFKPRAEKELKNLELKIDDKLQSFVNGDSEKICRVFINILDNAMKYTDENGIITISVQNKGNYSEISFEDNGCGISEYDLLHVKEKFYKANNNKHGTGIGLSVVDEIVKLHSGRFEIESQLGKGTKATIYLPMS